MSETPEERIAFVLAVAALFLIVWVVARAMLT